MDRKAVEVVMGPRKEIMVPAQAMERIARFRIQEKAADIAAEAMMRTPIVDWQGTQTTLQAAALGIGNAEAIRDAARDLFMALTSEGITYRRFRTLSASPGAMPEALNSAVQHFRRVIADSNDLQSMGLGDGDLLLVPFDWYVERYLKAQPSKPAQRLVS